MPKFSSIRRASVAALSLLVSAQMLSAPAMADANGVTTEGGTTLGSTLNIKSNFSAPGGAAGNYLVDTEVFSSSGAKVAQWYENNVYLSGSNNVRNYSWNTNGLGAGSYRFEQGIFLPDWASNRNWNSNAGSVSLSVPAPVSTVAPSWSLSATASGTSNVVIDAKFKAPSDFVRKNVLVDTEVFSPAGAKVGQWFTTTSIGAGETVSRTSIWNASSFPAGTYQVRLGVFSPDWSVKYFWQDGLAKIVRTTSPAPVAVTTTTIKPATTTTSVAPTTTTTVKPTTTTVAPAPVPTVLPVLPSLPASGNDNPFWVDPSNPAFKQAEAWRSSRPADAALMDKIGSGGAAVWLGGWNWDVRSDVNRVTSDAAVAGKIPVLVTYNIPGRDCGQYSSGGASGGDAYKSWIRSVASGIGNNRAMVVLEPDALSQLDCLDASSRSARLALLNDAVDVLSSNPNASVYIDAGHSGWHSATEIASRLNAAGVSKARGFSLNVSNYASTAENTIYGEAVSALTGGKNYIVDTSRNGNGANGEWCNPRGRALGNRPTTSTGTLHGDAFVWVKRPGESDGTCNGGPNAGEWWSDYALELARNAGY